MNTQKEISLSDLLQVFMVPEPGETRAADSALDVQEGGDHYKKMGAYQPWEVAFAQLTPEEFKGAMKITVMSYLAREADKGGAADIRKAAHTLQIYLELEARRTAQQQPDGCGGCSGGCADCRSGDASAEAAPKPQENTSMNFDPATGLKFSDVPYLADDYRTYNGPVAWLYNPWTGHKRDPRDIGADVFGHLITPQ